MGASLEITTTARCRKNHPDKSIKSDYIKAEMSFCLGENKVLMPLNLLLQIEKFKSFFSIKRITFSFSFHIRSFNLQLQKINKLLFITASDKKPTALILNSLQLSSATQQQKQTIMYSKNNVILFFLRRNRSSLLSNLFRRNLFCRRRFIRKSYIIALLKNH